MAHAPSRYEYRSTAEWQQAMREWCAENEPAHKLYQHDEATDTYRPVFKSDLDLFPKHQYCPAAPKHYAAPGTIPAGHPHADHLDGGSRSDYRMAGYKRY